MRRRMSRKKSKRAFRKGTGVHRRNYQNPARAGRRI